MEQGTKTTPAVEVWKDIEGYEGLYQVSNLGRVRSLDRWVSFGRNKRFVHSKIIKQYIKHGYFNAVLGYKNNEIVHRLVAKSFVPNPDNMPEVNHKDENKLNNRADNLEWCDRQYNINYGTGKWRGKDTRRKNVEQLTLEGRHVAYYTGARETARQTGFDQSKISAVCRGEKKSAYGYQWRYV